MTADDLWDKGAAALREQLAPATWNTWFHGVRPVSYDRRAARARGAELARRRAHPLELRRACSPTRSVTAPA